MSSGGEPYGWGVFSIPMPHEVGTADPAGLPLFRLLSRDIPWRTIGLSMLLTCLVLAAALWFRILQPEPPERIVPPPVEVTVMLPQPAPVPPKPVAAPPLESVPPPKPKVQAPPAEPPPPVAAPEPVAPPKPVVTPEPVVRPEPIPLPEPVMVRQPPAEPRPQALPKPKPVQIMEQTEPLPKPTQLAQRLPRRQAQSPSALPKRQAAVRATTAEALPVAPRVAAFADKPRAANTAELPQQAAALRSKAAAVSLAVQPAATQIAQRTGARSAMPQSAAASFASPARAQLAVVDTGLAQVRHARPDTAARLPDMPRAQTLTTGRSGEPAVAVPQTSGLQTGLEPRSATVSAPAMNQSKVALASKTDEQELSGPAATVMPTGAVRSAPLATEGSYDFLDLVAASELDPSVMISLNRLNTCRDPGEETQLKTRLAVLLNQADLCRSGGVVFAVRNPESAYSIHIDLYNYAQREFRDRCDALRLAVQSCAARR